MATYWQMAQTQGNLSVSPLPPPTTFKWVHAAKKVTISGLEVSTGRPAVELTWNALKPEQYHDLLALFNVSSQIIYVVVPKEHNLLTTATRLVGDVEWGVYKGKLARPETERRHTSPSQTGWSESVTVRVTQIEYIQTHVP